ncbi:MAG: DsbA family protein [bacterium]
MSPPRARLNLQDILRSADRAGVKLRMPADHPRRTVAAMRLILSAPVERQKAVAQDPSRPTGCAARMRSAEVLAAVAARHGLDVAAIEAPAVKQALFDTTAEAFERGVFGVPTFAVGGRLHWGQDRMHFVEALLGGPTTAAPPAPAEAPGPARVRFFHDYASPYSYLAAQRIEAVAAAAGARLEWVPILLGGLFRAIGTPDVPMLALSAARQAWVGRDLADWAAWWKVPFSFPNHFPLARSCPCA